MNKKGAAARKHVLLINADREYRDGKAQNFLRPEDIDKIVHTYRSMQDVPGYAKRVSKDDIIAEEYNSISGATWTMLRRLSHTMSVRTSTAAFPLPKSTPLATTGRITPVSAPSAFSRGRTTPNTLTSRLNWQTSGKLPKLLPRCMSVLQRHAEFLAEVEYWWQANVSRVEKLAPVDNGHGNVYALRRELLASISEALKNQSLLNAHQVRGAFANYVDDLKADLKSIAASGWGPELIPDDEIVASQFPEVLEQLEKDRARLAELQSLFAAAKEEDYEDSEETGVLQEDQAKSLRDEKKKLDDTWKQSIKDLKGRIEDLFVQLRPTGKIPAGAVKSHYTAGLSLRNPDFNQIDRICAAALSAGGFDNEVRQIEDLSRLGAEALIQARKLRPV